MKKFLIATIAAFSMTAIANVSLAAGGGEQHIEDFDFSYEGPFGTFDQFQLQRGLQVFTEVCAACHGMKYVGFYSLDDEGGPGLPTDQVRAYAGSFEVYDPKLRDTRPATYGDKFPESSLEGAPDLSLMAKARAGFHGPYGLGINQLVKGMGGGEYIASILTGYTGREKEEAGSVFYENTAFPGGWISMPPPLADDGVEYADGHSADVHHQAMDVSAFLMWTAEPNLAARKKWGMTIFILLAVLTTLLYMTNKVLWANIKHRKE